jgi:trimeric autotransporter adhesin
MKNNCLRLAVLIFLIAGTHTAHAQIITTIAGNDTGGYNGDNIPAVSAQLYQPNDIAFDGTGNVYIVDGKNNRIRKINAAGIITTIAGTGIGGYNGDDMQATAAELNYPSSMTFDASSNMYITDDFNFRIRKINSTGIISTIAGTGSTGFSGDNGIATLANIGSCVGIVVDKTGDIYIDDGDYDRIRKISNSGIITTVAGNGFSVHSGDNGPATSSSLMEPNGLALDGSGNLYFAEYSGSCIRKISTSGIITTVVGTGTAGYSGDGRPATSAELYYPTGVSIDNGGNFYISDGTSSVIRKVDPSGIISTIAGTGDGGYSGDGGPATLAQLKSPSIARADVSGNIYIADWANNRVR